MKRPMVVLTLGLVLLAPACAGFKIRLADDALTDGDPARAYRLLKGPAKRGNPTAQYRVGLMLTQGKGVRPNEEKAIAWYRKAARQGVAEAQDQLAHLYLAGRGGPQDDPDAERWLLQAATEGSPDTKYRVATMYFKGDVLPQNDDAALEWYRAAADELSATAKTIDVRLVQDGLLKEVAELGLAEAQLRLGKMYSSGNHVPKSQAEAAKWFYLAANQGYAPAQLTLGWIYSQGHGVPKDYAEAVRWFAKAAEQGDPEAQYQLGQSFRRGVGVPNDDIEAHKWFNLAAGQGHWRAREKRDSLTKELTPLQLEEAERLAIEWKPKGKEESEP